MEANHADPQKNQGTISSAAESSTSQNGAQLRETVSDDTPQCRRILVVDDNRDAAQTLAMMLKMMGHVARVGYGGEEALALAAEFRPDLVLLDIGMPHVDGYETCRRIRAQPWGPSMALVAVTGWGQAEDRRLSREAGFDEHLLKPVDLAVLRRVLETCRAPCP